MNVRISVNGVPPVDQTVPKGSKVVDVWNQVKGNRNQDEYLVHVEGQPNAEWETVLHEGWTIWFAPNKILVISVI